MGEKSEMVEGLMHQVCGVVQKRMKRNVMSFALDGDSNHSSSKVMDEEGAAFPKFSENYNAIEGKELVFDPGGLVHGEGTSTAVVFVQGLNYCVIQWTIEDIGAIACKKVRVPCPDCRGGWEQSREECLGL